MLERHVVEFPDDLTDRAGRRLRPGSVVTVTEGPHAGTLAEVVGWGGRRGVELAVPGEVHEVVVVPAGQLVRVDRFLDEPLAVGWGVHTDRRGRVAVVQPVGARDVQPRKELGPFPSPAQFRTSRGPMREAVAARAWGEACLESVAGLPETEAAALVAAHLDAPMLRRVLIEAALPPVIDRVILVVTDQDPPHQDDTLPFGRLLELWVKGTTDLPRQVAAFAPPIVLHARPDLLDPCLASIRPVLAELTTDVELVVAVQAGGTPAMSFAVLLACALDGRTGRHIQVPLDQPLVELDLPSLVTVGPRWAQ